MEKNLNMMKDLIYSQQVLMKLTGKVLKRETAYEIVQRNAMEVWSNGYDFKALLLDDKDIMENLEKEEIDEIFNLDYHFKHVEDIFERIFH